MNRFTNDFESCVMHFMQTSVFSLFSVEENIKQSQAEQQHLHCCGKLTYISTKNVNVMMKI